MRGLTSSNGVVDTVVDTVVGQQDGACGGSAGHSQEGEADKGLKENLTETSQISLWSQEQWRAGHRGDISAYIIIIQCLFK